MSLTGKYLVKLLQPTNRLSDKGLKAILVGYVDEHAGNVYQFLNPSTNRIILSRDVKWLSKSYGEEKHVKPSFVMPTVCNDISKDDEKTIEETDTDVSEDEEEISTSMEVGTPTQSRRQEIRGLDIGQQIMPGRTRQQTHEAIQSVEENLDNFYQDCELMSAIITGKSDEPKTFQAAWYYNDQEK